MPIPDYQAIMLPLLRPSDISKGVSLQDVTPRSPQALSSILLVRHRY